MAMGNKLDAAIAELAKLPPEEQEVAAEAILDFADRGGRPKISEAQAHEVRRRLAEPEPKFLTLAEARARLLG
jgi:hypothetical protein